MTSLETCIREAVEGGWIPKWFERDPSSPHYIDETIFRLKDRMPETFLDPLFWQALGRARGWTNFNRCPVCKKTRPKTFTGISEWQHQWHSFIDHLAEGKDVESFFAAL